jgi:hypothetical protein
MKYRNIIPFRHHIAELEKEREQTKQTLDQSEKQEKESVQKAHTLELEVCYSYNRLLTYI